MKGNVWTPEDAAYEEISILHKEIADNAALFSRDKYEDLATFRRRYADNAMDICSNYEEEEQL